MPPFAPMPSDPASRGSAVLPFELRALPGEFEAPEFVKALQQIRTVSDKLQMPGGVHIVEPDPQALRQCINEGNQFIAYGVDTRMLDTACRHCLKYARDGA